MSAMRGQLRQLAHDALVAAPTLAGNNVFLPRDWPTNSGTMPNISVQTPKEHKTPRSGRNGPPLFTTTCWLQLRCQVAANDPVTVETNLETLIDQAEAVVMGLLILPQVPPGGGAAQQLFQQILQGEYEIDLSSDGSQHTGVATLMYGFEYPERFAPTISADLDGLNIVAADGAVPAVLLATSAATAAGNAVLTFAAAVPGAIVPGLAVFDATTAGAVQLGSEVQSVSGPTVTLTKTAIGSGVAAGDTIVFSGPLLAQADLNT